MKDDLFKSLIEQKAKMLAWNALDESERARYLDLATKDLKNSCTDLATGLAVVLKKYNEKS